MNIMLYELCDAESNFEKWLSIYAKALKRHNANMRDEKDVLKLKDILRTLNNLEYELAGYKKWVEQKIEKLDCEKNGQNGSGDVYG